MLRKIIRTAFEGITGTDIEIHGASLALIPRKKRINAWFSYRAQLRALLDQRKVDLVIDVGANEGQFGAGLRGMYDGEIISFEPVSAAFGILQKRATGKWRAVNIALGAESAWQEINVSKRTVFSSLLAANDFNRTRFGEDARETGKEMISIMRLDDWLRENVPDWQTRRIFLKMDTQGYDAKVFAGAAGILSSVVMLQSELSLIPIYNGMPHWTETATIYERGSFRIAGLFPVSRDKARAVIEYDCLMVRA